MSPPTVVVASTLGAAFDDHLRQLPARPKVISLPPRAPWALPAEANFLVYMYREAAGTDPESVRPQGWPGSVAAVQCATTGIDGYPQWLFEAPVVACARGSHSAAI